MKKSKTTKKTVKKIAKRVPPLHEDQIKAQEIRDRLREALGPVCDILTEATACGFACSFQLSDPAGRTGIAHIFINRRL